MLTVVGLVAKRGSASATISATSPHRHGKSRSNSRQRSAETLAMAPSKKPAAKGGDKSKDKGKSSASKDDSSAGASKLKAATAINTRHILVQPPHPLPAIPTCMARHADSHSSAKNMPRKKKP